MPPDAGDGFFAGGIDGTSGIEQTIDLRGFADVIEAGNVRFTLSAWLGGFQSQDDNAGVEIDFRDADGNVLGFASIGGDCAIASSVCAVDRGGETGFRERTTDGPVPVGTRSIFVLLLMERVSGTSNDGYADELSLVLNN